LSGYNSGRKDAGPNPCGEPGFTNLAPQGRLNFRPVQIRFERCLGSATALSSQRPSPFCHPEGNRAVPAWLWRDLRCAIRVPRSYRPTTSTNHHRILMETSTSPLSFRVSRSGPRNRRSARLRSPGFPVEIGGVGELHAPFLTRKAHTQPCPAQRGRKSGSG
jgi:hypothetical protein